MSPKTWNILEKKNQVFMFKSDMTSEVNMCQGGDVQWHIYT